MLNYFTFSNFKSFKNEATLDMRSADIKEQNDTTINGTNLPVAVIYGPNGGGKSSVLEAFSYLSKKIVSPIILSGTKLESEKEESGQIQGRNLFEYTPHKIKDYSFKFDDDANKSPAEFIVSFSTKKSEYTYSLSLFNEKVKEEYLIDNSFDGEPRVIFERDSKGISLGDCFKSVMTKKVNESLPLLSYIGMTQNIKEIDDVLGWFINCVFLNYNNPRTEHSIYIIEKTGKRKKFFEVLRDMDINITDIRIVKDNDGHIREIFTKHQMEDGSLKELMFEEESSGTKKLFALLPLALECLWHGRLLIADEMDAKIHPALLKYLIDLFTNPEINKKGAQLIFTSHDITTMDKSVFRKDEIWFSALNKHEASVLYSLVELEKYDGKNGNPVDSCGGESYGKQYLEGRYGADPYLNRILNWGDFIE